MIKTLTAIQNPLNLKKHNNTNIYTTLFYTNIYTTLYIILERSLFCSPRLHKKNKKKYSKNSEILLQFKTAVFYVSE